jgi:uncharacterized protein
MTTSTLYRRLPLLAFCASLLLACVPAGPVASVPQAAEPGAYAVPVDLTSGDARLKATMYVTSGAGPHPTVILLHGFPGGPRLASLAEALQQEGFNVLFLHYRGTWGSEGWFRLDHAVEDAEAALDFVQSASAGARFRVDPSTVALVGHSMGGWIAFNTAVRRPDAECIALLGVANVGEIGRQAGIDSGFRQGWTRSIERATTGDGAPIRTEWPADAIVADLIDNAERYDLTRLADRLNSRTVLLVGADQDVVAPMARHHTAVLDALRAGGTGNPAEVVLVSDHDFRETQPLASAVADWLRGDCVR